MQLREFRRLNRAIRMRPAAASALCGAAFPADPDARQKWENRWQKRLMGE